MNLGTPLERKVGLLILLIALAGFLLVVPTWRVMLDGFRDPTMVGFAMGACLLGLLVLCLAGSYFLWSQQIWVAPDALRLTRGGRVRREITLGEIDKVEPGIDYGLNNVPSHDRIIVWKTLDNGYPLGIYVTGRLVKNLSPVVAVLAPVVAQRPEVLQTEEAREAWADLRTRW